MLTPRESAIFEKASRVLSYAFRGLHHLNLKKGDRLGKHHVDGNLVEVVIGARGGLSTWDYDELTRLVVAAHAEFVRLEILPSGPGLLKLRLSARVPLEQAGTQPMMMGHPTIYQAAAGYEDPVTWAEVVGAER